MVIYAFFFAKCREPLIRGFRKKTPLSVRRCGGGGAKGGTESVHSFVTFFMWIDSLRTCWCTTNLQVLPHLAGGCISSHRAHRLSGQLDFLFHPESFKSGGFGPFVVFYKLKFRILIYEFPSILDRWLGLSLFFLVSTHSTGSCHLFVALVEAQNKLTH